MGPVRAPDDPPRRRLDERPRHRRHFPVGQIARRDAVRAGELDPALAGASEAHHGLEPGLADVPAGAHIAHMADDDLGREVGEHGIEAGIIIDVDQELGMPAQRLDAFREARHRAERDGARGIGDIDEVEAQPPDAGIMEPFDVGVRDRFIDDGDGAAPGAGLRQRFHQHRVVGAVDAGLDQHRALHSEGAEHLQIITKQGVGRRVDAPRRIRVGRFRPADMGVSVASARRQDDLWLTRLRVRRGAKRRLGVFARRVWDFWLGHPRNPCRRRVRGRPRVADQAGRSQHQGISGGYAVAKRLSVTGRRLAPHEPGASSKTPASAVSQRWHLPSGVSRQSLSRYQSRPISRASQPWQ